MKKKLLTLMMALFMVPVFSQNIVKHNLIPESRIFTSKYVMAFDYNNDGYEDIVANGDGYYPFLIGYQNNRPDTYGYSVDTLIFPHTTINAFNHHDFNGDGYEDIIFNIWSDSTYIYTNDGQGYFSRYAAFKPAGNDVGGLKLADIDNDGDMDVFELSYIVSPRHLEVSYYLNEDGEGKSFSERIVIPALSDINEDHRNYYIEDINDDGYVEIVVASNGNYSLYVHYGSPELDYLNRREIGGQHMTITDFEKDGVMDVVTNSAHGISRYKLIDDTLVFHKNYLEENGIFSDGGDISFGYYNPVHPDQIVIAASSYYTWGPEPVSETVPTFYQYDASQDEFDELVYSLDSNPRGSIIPVDANGNGIQEALFYDGGSDRYQRKLYTKALPSSGEPSSRIINDGTYRTIQTQVIDHNKDGKRDIIVGTSYIPEIRHFDNMGNYEFEERRGAKVSHLPYTDFEFTDFNDDGHLDVIHSNARGLHVNYSSYHDTIGGVWLYDSTSNSPQKGTVNCFTTLHYNDNNKIKKDIAIGDDNGNLHVLVQITHDSVFRHFYNASASKIVDVESADFNNDGIDDLALLSASNLLIFYGIDDDNWPIIPTVDIPLYEAKEMELADMNNDGFMDIVILSGDGLWVENHVDYFSDIHGDGILATPSSLTAMDYDNDDDQDVLWVSNYGLRVFRNDSLGYNFTSEVLSSEGGWYIDKGDIDNDGIPEPIVAGEMQTWWLTLCFENSDTITVSACDQYILSDGQVVNESGLYEVVHQTAKGCDSTIVVDLQINESPTVFLGNDTTISKTHTLELDAGEGFESYQWNTGDTTHSILIDGAVSDTGQYTYHLTATDINGCVATDSILVTIKETLGINDGEMDNRLATLYPNPTTGKLHIEINKVVDQTSIVIYSQAGKIIHSEMLKPENSTIKKQLELSTHPPGSYFVEILNENMAITKKIILIK